MDHLERDRGPRSAPGTSPARGPRPSPAPSGRRRTRRSAASRPGPRGRAAPRSAGTARRRGASGRGPRRRSSQRRSWSMPANLVNQGRRPLAIPSATQMRISASLCTESFQRYASSTPTLKMPPIGLLPIVGAVLLRVLAVGPRGHEPAPRLAVGEQRRGELADGLHVERAGRAAPGVRDDARVGVDLADLRVPEPPELEEALLVPGDVRASRGILRVVRPRQLVPGRGPEVRPAVLAVAHPGAGPAVDEDAVDACSAS